MNRGRGVRQGPLEIEAVGRGRKTTMRALADSRAGLGFAPFMDFRMAVGKAEPASAVVVACRQIINPGARIVRADDNEPIVDAVRVLIHEHPQVRRGRPADIAHLIVLEAIWRIWPGGDGGIAISITDAIPIHRVAS